MISAVDDWVGAVLAKLREHGLEENTLVIFTSDNGAALGDVAGIAELGHQLGGCLTHAVDAPAPPARLAGEAITRHRGADDVEGVLAYLKELVQYWRREFDWRKQERKLNEFPQFTTEIGGVDIHFIHVRSKHENALPLVLAHGWPDSVFGFQKVIGPLTDPEAHGGKAEDAFHVVCPSMAGYGFSGKPTGQISAAFVAAKNLDASPETSARPDTR